MVPVFNSHQAKGRVGTHWTGCPSITSWHRNTHTHAHAPLHAHAHTPPRPRPPPHTHTHLTKMSINQLISPSCFQTIQRLPGRTTVCKLHVSFWDLNPETSWCKERVVLMSRRRKPEYPERRMQGEKESRAWFGFMASFLLGTVQASL